MKRPRGRPSSMTPEILKKAGKYLEWCEKNPLEGNKKMPRLPSLAGLTRFLNVSRESIRNWANGHEDFNTIFESVKVEQEKMLIEYGLFGKCNSLMAKFMLSAQHGYREKTDLTSNGRALPTPILAHVHSNPSNSQSAQDVEEDQGDPGRDQC